MVVAVDLRGTVASVADEAIESLALMDALLEMVEMAAVTEAVEDGQRCDEHWCHWRKHDQRFAGTNSLEVVIVGCRCYCRGTECSYKDGKRTKADIFGYRVKHDLLDIAKKRQIEGY